MPTPLYKRRSKSYNIKTGDTLTSIANRFGLQPSQLAQANSGVGIMPGNAITIPEPAGTSIWDNISRINTAASKQTISYNYPGTKPITSAASLPNASTMGVNQTRQPMAHPLQGYGRPAGTAYLNLPSAPRLTTMPDVYVNSPHPPGGYDYRANLLAMFEARGMPAPVIDVETAKAFNMNPVTLVQAGYIKVGNTWQYTQSTGAGTTGGGEGYPQYNGAWWEHQQRNVLRNAQAYGSRQADKRNLQDMMAYKEAKRENPGLTYRNWAMMQSGWRKGGKARYADQGAAPEETYGTPAVQTAYSNPYYSSTGRYMSSNSGGLITWRT